MSHVNFPRGFGESEFKQLFGAVRVMHTDTDLNGFDNDGKLLGTANDFSNELSQDRLAVKLHQYPDGTWRMLGESKTIKRMVSQNFFKGKVSFSRDVMLDLGVYEARAHAAGPADNQNSTIPDLFLNQ